MAARCEACGQEEYMPYACKFCKGKYCAAHRLPENHGCQGLGAYRERLRQEGRVLHTPDPMAEPVRPTVARTARAGASVEAFWDWVDQKMTYVFMGVAVFTFLLQFTLVPTRYLAIGEDFLVQPWTIVTSIFAHGSLNHLFFNMLFLLFFGSTVERLLGTRRFTYLFLAAGAVAGIAQIVITQIIFQGEVRPAVGASGALQGVFGLLLVLAPRLTVLVFFVIPAPLWALGVFFVLFDLFGAFDAASPVAHFAHLAGLAVGMAYGWHLRQKGFRAMQQQPPPPPMRRPF